MRDEAKTRVDKEVLNAVLSIFREVKMLCMTTESEEKILKNVLSVEDDT